MTDSPHPSSVGAPVDSAAGAVELSSESCQPADAPRSLLERVATRHGLPRVDVAVVVVVGIFTIAWAPIFIVGSVPRLAIAYGLAPLGLGLIVTAARRGDRAALAAIGLCIAIVISGIFAEAPRAAFVGQLPEWSSALALVASVGWWGVGRSLSRPGRLWLARVLALGGVLNGAVAFAQLASGSKPGEMFVISERGAGLMGNPVFFGTFMVGVLGLWLSHTSQRGSGPRLALCAGLAFFTALSGGRVVLGAAVVVMIACLIIWKRAAMWPVCLGVIGFVVGDRTLDVFSADVSSVDRLVGGESIGSRLAIWRLSLDAAVERPVFGWGPANSEIAVMRRIDLAFAQDQWAEGSVQTWWDPHNALVFMLVSLGVVGTVAVGLLIAASMRGERDWPVIIAVFAMCATWTLQPFTVHSLPVAMLLLGAAARARKHRPDEQIEADETQEMSSGALPSSASIVGWQRAAFAFGALIAIVLLSAAFLVDRWSSNGRPDQAARAAMVFGGDPWLDSYISVAYMRAFHSGEGDMALVDQAVRYSRRSSETYPTSEHLQDLADLSVAFDDVDTGLEALNRAVELHPWDPLALARLYSVAVIAGDDELAESVNDRLCTISDFWCGFTDLFEETEDAGVSE